VAAEHGQTVDRRRWRLAAPVHLAETRDKALKNVVHGMDAWGDYIQHTVATPQFQIGGTTTKERIEWLIDSGVGIIGTVEDAIEQIERLWEQSHGGFGTFLIIGTNLADWAETKNSYHLFANRVNAAFPGFDSASPVESGVGSGAA